MYKAPRGTADVIPQDQPYWQYVADKARALCQVFGYQRIDTPIFEEAGLFHRSVGEATDIVEKEMYTFLDKGGSEMTLRPEGTAPVCRAYIEHGMHNLPQPVKLYYVAPAFRYERPQSGRYRQHTQIGVEALGESDPALDAEMLSLAWNLLTDLGLTNLDIHLNSIGCPQCRPNYLAALVDYYRPLDSTLCRDCQSRLARNPLRLLDCKEASCQPIADGAPRSIDHLGPECAEPFEALKDYLKALDVPFSLNTRLVRGLDYYTKTVFEIQPREGGSQSTIAAGGRYDGLIEALGGRPTPGIGFATGIERIVLNLKRQGMAVPDGSRPKVCIAYLGKEAKVQALKLAWELRRGGVGTVVASGDRSLRSQLRYANSMGASYTVIIGEEEINTGTVLLRKMEESEQVRVPMAELVGQLTGEATGSKQ